MKHLKEKRNGYCLDFTKAVNKINYKILMEEAAKQNIRIKLGRWFKGFLKNRT